MQTRKCQAGSEADTHANAHLVCSTTVYKMQTLSRQQKSTPLTSSGGASYFEESVQYDAELKTLIKSNTFMTSVW